MKLPLLLFALILLGGLPTLSAQTFHPLIGYESLQADDKPGFATKRACPTFDFTDVERVIAGDTAIFVIELDTFGLGPDPDISCAGCAGNAGTTILSGDSLIYASAPGVEEGLDTITVTPCTADGSICNAAITTVVLVQRAPRTVNLGSFNVGPEETIELPIPDGDLPNGAFCRRLTSCADDYPARDQNLAFIEEEQENGNDVRYQAGRYGGTDVVCVEICNRWGLCDLYRTTITINRTTIGLPFFDDFSYDQRRPSITLWQDEDVLINREFAVGPPSIGVATFDAVTNRGLPYATTGSAGQSVRRDFLTSAPIDMENERGARLTFYVQGRGRGNRPETADSFLVEFLTFAGGWQPVYSQAGFRNTVGAGTPIPFDSVALAVPDEYLYDGFQFRFTSKSSEVGAVDMWHLDYVKLERGGEDFVTEDLAFLTEPSYLVSPYSSLPIRHFVGVGANSAVFSTLVDTTSMRVALRNLNDESIRLNSARVNLDQRTSSDFTLVRTENLTNNFIPGGSNSTNLVTFNLPGIAQLEPTFPAFSMVTDTASSFFFAYGSTFSLLRQAELNGIDEAAFRVTYSVNPANNQENTQLGNGIIENNTVARTTFFGNYMAYDDGSAEVTVEAGRDVTIVQEYEAFVEDELLGTQIRIPRGLGNLGNQDLELVVYTGEDGPEDLVYSEAFPILYAEQFFLDSLEAFTTYVFAESVPIDTGKFYVGWRQADADRSIGVGYDRNNPLQERQWVSSGFGFNNIRGTIEGAIMLRPLLGGFTGNTTAVSEETGAEALIDAFPNPTNGALHLRPRHPAPVSLRYRLLSMTGQVLHTDRPLPRTVNLGDLPAGIYLLEVTDGEVRSQHKIVRR